MSLQMKKTEIDQLIDKQILGTISSDEAKKLELSIEQNPELKKDIELRRDLAKSLQYMEQETLKTMLEKIHQEEIVTKGGTGFKPWIIYALVSFLLLLAGVSYLLLSKPSKTEQGPQYFAQNYSTYIPSIGERGADEESELAFLSYYQEKKYDKVLDLIKDETEALTAEEQLMAGISALETEQVDLAIQYFDSIIESEDYFFVDHAAWYKALALLKKNDLPAAMPLLEGLTQSPSKDHYQEAQKLLNQIQ
jgi:tetratricopeptide (TPR) repeat protein